MVFMDFVWSVKILLHENLFRTHNSTCGIAVQLLSDVQGRKPTYIVRPICYTSPLSLSPTLSLRKVAQYLASHNSV